MSDPSISYPHQQHNHHHYQHHNHHHHHHHHQQQSAVLNASSPTTSIAGVDSAQVVYRQSRTERRSNSFAMATCYSAYELSPPQPPPPPPPAPQRTVQVPVQKDYSRPLHVDCSVEYELPNTAKPPQGVRNEPLLMIHPCYFRKIESQRRSPFVNNLPVRQQQQQQQQQQHHQHHQHHHHQQHQQLQQQQQHQPVATAVTTAVKRRRPQQPQAAQYPAPYAAAAPNWEQMPPLVPISQAYKRDPMSSITSTSISTSACAAYSSSSGSDSGHWTDPDHSPDRPDDINNKQQQSHHQQQQQHHHHHHQQHILTGKYRQYLRAHRLHPYVTSAIPLASTFPQIQQVCYNV